ncbi:DUF6879 family protein [Nocardiopsis sediminis]|uniref:DUF6879 family protein n=1 Tax=Nocardiopsis sediminis TaxID=1778267 RepID=A0ABV8FU88_9ACTN
MSTQTPGHPDRTRPADRGFTALELAPERGVRLSNEEFESDLLRRRREAPAQRSWRFERRQHARERDHPSWEAFERGRWDESLRLLERHRPRLRAQVRGDEHGCAALHRVRVVEEPLTPYLQWELHRLRIQAECGHPVRVVPGAALSALETSAPLPEVIVIGAQALYEVLHTERGLVDGAIRFTDPALAGRWQRFIGELFANGEDVRSYTDRYVFRLPPPRTSA